MLAAVTPLDAELVPLDEALGRVLAEELRSAADLPRFHSSAMDGFAVPAGAEGELRIAGEARAGGPSQAALEPGTAMRISTGASVPAGTGAVVSVERAEEVGGMVRVPSSPAGENIRPRGEVLVEGELLLRPGAALTPAGLGVAASAGRADVRCARRPRVAILATGDELADPGHDLAPGQIWSSNPLALAGQVRLAGGVVQRTETVPDDPEATRTALAGAAAAADVLCVSGGVSVGPHDHVKGALAELQFEEGFWRVALKPGKPTWFGVRAGPAPAVLAFGLPGNPVSAMVTFQLFVRLALRAMQGADPTATRATAVLDAELTRNPAREEAVRCRLAMEDDGLHAVPTGPQGSHVITSMLAADCLALIEAGEGPVRAGDRVPVELLAGVSSAS